MVEEEAIKYLDSMKKGMFCTINIPILKDKKVPTTVMYMGKDKQGRYNFLDAGRLIVTKRFIKEKVITVDKEYDLAEAKEINSKVVKVPNKKVKNQER